MSSARRRTGHRRSRWAGALEPELVLLDVALPDMDGFAVCEALQEERPGPAVILTSSRAVSSYRRETEAESGARVHPEERALRPVARRARGRLASWAAPALALLGAVGLTVAAEWVSYSPATSGSSWPTESWPPPRDVRHHGLGAARGEPGRAADGALGLHVVRRQLLVAGALPAPRAARPPLHLVPDGPSPAAVRTADRCGCVRRRGRRADRSERRRHARPCRARRRAALEASSAHPAPRAGLASGFAAALAFASVLASGP